MVFKRIEDTCFIVRKCRVLGFFFEPEGGVILHIKCVGPLKKDSLKKWYRKGFPRSHRF